MEPRAELRRIWRPDLRHRDKSTWGPCHNDSPFFEGEVEPRINGRVLACGANFGEASDRRVDRLLSEQLEDGQGSNLGP